jgi:hypothetical protein
LLLLLLRWESIPIVVGLLLQRLVSRWSLLLVHLVEIHHVVVIVVLLLLILVKVVVIVDRLLLLCVQSIEHVEVVAT